MKDEYLFTCIPTLIELRSLAMYSSINGFLVRPGRGAILYKLYRCVSLQTVWFSSRFGLKTGIDFDHYRLK